MIPIPRHLDTGAVATIGIILLLFLTISNTSSGTLQHLNQMPNKMIVKSATHTGQEGGEVDLRMPEALWLTLQEGDLAREIPATELRVPRPPRTSQRTRESGRFAFIQSDLHFDHQQVKVQIDRDRAADLGIDMGHLAEALATRLSEVRVNYFSLQGGR